MEVSDRYEMCICDLCGLICVGNTVDNRYFCKRFDLGRVCLVCFCLLKSLPSPLSLSHPLPLPLPPSTPPSPPPLPPSPPQLQQLRANFAREGTLCLQIVAAGSAGDFGLAAPRGMTGCTR